MMDRNSRKILAWAKKQGLKVEDVPNKLHQITHGAVRKRRLKLNPRGITVLIRNNEPVLIWREQGTAVILPFQIGNIEGG